MAQEISNSDDIIDSRDVMDRTEVESAVLAAHAAACGKIFPCVYLSWIDDAGTQQEATTVWEAPFMVEVVATSRDALLHWTDAEHCDPYWDVLLAAPHSLLSDEAGAGSGLWTFGVSPTDTDDGCIRVAP